MLIIKQLQSVLYKWTVRLYIYCMKKHEQIKNKYMNKNLSFLRKYEWRYLSQSMLKILVL